MVQFIYQNLRSKNVGKRLSKNWDIHVSQTLEPFTSWSPDQNHFSLPGHFARSVAQGLYLGAQQDEAQMHGDLSLL